MTIVFIGMETSGALRRRFQSYGFETYSCDTLPSEDGGEEMAYSADRRPLGRHMVGDVYQTLEHLKSCDLWPSLAVFHITCTYLTGSAEWAFKDPDFDRYPGVGYHQRVKPGTLTGAARREAREKSMAEFKGIERLPIARKIVENPVGALSRIRKPSQIVQPYQFGDDASKKTCFWFIGPNGEPLPDMALPIDPKRYYPPRLVCRDCKTTSQYGAHKCPSCGSHQLDPRWSNQTDSNQNALSPDDDRWKNRSRTFPGVADLAAAYWSALLLDEPVNSAV